MTEAQQQQSQQKPITLSPETEASDLRELHLSAKFLTPYAVAPTTDQRVWLSNTKQTYIDFTVNKPGACKLQ